MRVGFIGVGNQGAPMAQRIGQGGFDLVVWARRAESVEPFRTVAASVAASPAELATGADAVCVCVRGDDDVFDVCTGASGVLAGMSSGSVLLIHSTVDPGTVRKVAEEAAAAGVDVLDAPVTGGGLAAGEGHLLTIVGGPPDVLERCRPFLSTHSDRIVHTGDVGSGQLAKLLNNGLFAAHAALADTAFRVGEAMGLDRDSLAQILTGGSGQSFALERVAQAAGVDFPAAVRGLLSKDVALLTGVLQGGDVGERLVTAANWVL